MATYYLIAANIGVYLWMAFAGVPPFDPGVEDLFHWGGSSSYHVANGEWWRLITSMFLHSGPVHLLMNLYALYSVGPLLELTLGKKHFLMAYFSTGILAGLASCLFHAETLVIGVGASGAIFGLFGVLLALLTTRFFPEEARDGLIKSIGLTIGLNVAYSFREGVDFAAHIGGLFGGLVIGYCLYLIFVFSKKSLAFAVYFCIAIITLGASSLSIQYLKNGDTFVFHGLKEQFVFQHEELGSLLSAFDEMSSKERVVHLEKVIIPKSEQIQKILTQMGELRLSKEQASFQEFVYELYSLQIEKFRLVVRSIKEDTAIYDPLLERLNKKYDDLISRQKEAKCV